MSLDLNLFLPPLVFFVIVLVLTELFLYRVRLARSPSSETSSSPTPTNHESRSSTLIPHQEPDWPELEHAYQQLLRNTQQSDSSHRSTRLTNDDTWVDVEYPYPTRIRVTGRSLSSMSLDDLLLDHSPTEQVSATESPTEPTTSSKVKNTHHDFIRKHTNTG